MMPAFIALNIVAGAWHENDQRDVRGADDVYFVLTDADRLDDDHVLARRIEDENRIAVALARPPRCPRVAMLRMNTPSSAA
jgi:hypothetical protein